jgi:polyisoprenoid-binding protein YceI
MRIPLIGLALVVTAAMTANAQGPRASLGAGSKIWIEGTSNVHAWKCEASDVDATIDLDAGLGAPANKIVKKVSVTLPVKGLKCGHGKMDENLQKALKANENANITYTLTTIEALPGETKDAFTIRASGTLTLAGAENAITMDIAASRLADGTIKATGTVPVKMTAFQVKPPTAMFGTIKCGDEVKIKFDLVVGPRVVAVVDK